MIKTILTTCLLFTACCVTPALTLSIHTDEIEDAVFLVVDRHDEYVRLDGNLDAVDRSELAQESVALVALMDAEYVSVSDFHKKGDALFSRHDIYVLNDVTLAEFEVRTYLRSTRMLSRLGRKNSEED